MMRTTVNIDEQLLQALKQRAAETDSSVSRVIESAVRLLLASRENAEPDRDEFELVTFGHGGRFSRFNVDKSSAFLAAEDLEKYGDREPGK